MLRTIACCDLCKVEAEVPRKTAGQFPVYWRRRVPPGWVIVTAVDIPFDSAQHWCSECLARARCVARGLEAPA
jgi:hypothetical protein